MVNGDLGPGEIARRLDRIDTRLEHIEEGFNEQIKSLRHRDNNLDTRVTANAERITAQKEVIDNYRRNTDSRIGTLEATLNKVIVGVLLLLIGLVAEFVMTRV